MTEEETLDNEIGREVLEDEELDPRDNAPNQETSNEDTPEEDTLDSEIELGEDPEEDDEEIEKDGW